jgi:endoglucanase
MLALAALSAPFYADPARTRHGRDAKLMRKLSRVPQARRFIGGSPRQVGRDVKQLLDRAAGRIPVLVAYDVPNRDCSQYSAGGARNARA